MPIEIRELIIRARVEPEAAPEAGHAAAPKAECGCAHGVSEDDLMRILKDRQER